MVYFGIQCSSVCPTLLNHSSCEEFLCLKLYSYRTLPALLYHFLKKFVMVQAHLVPQVRQQLCSPFVRATVYHKQHKLSSKKEDWRTWIGCGETGEHWPHWRDVGAAVIMSECFSSWGQNRSKLYLVIKSTGKCNRIKKDTYLLKLCPFNSLSYSPYQHFGAKSAASSSSADILSAQLEISALWFALFHLFLWWVLISRSSIFFLRFNYLGF